jgi:hypothetical protein
MQMKYFRGAIAIVALSLALVGCGSGNKSGTNATSSSTSTSASGSATSSATGPTPGAQAHKTIADYITDSHITDTPVNRGDPGSPIIDLPVPAGWRVDEQANAGYGGIVFAQPANPADPPEILANVHKLSGDVDPAKIIQYAPGGLQNLPGYVDSGNGKASTLSGFQAWQLNGTYVKDGTKRAAAQKTVVIPAQGAVFVLQLDADSLDSDQGVLMDATDIIDDQTTIKL